MRRDVVEEAFRNPEAPEVLEAVQQPVDVGRIAARLELPEPHEPRHAGVDRLLEQMLEVAPQPGRHPARRCGLRSGAPRRRARPAGWPACAGRPRRTSGPGPRSTAPAVLLRGAARRAHAPRRPRRTGSRRCGATPPDARAGLGPHRVVAELLPVQMELAADEVHGRRGNELARGQQAARVSGGRTAAARSRACCGDAAGPRCFAGPRRSGW